MVTNRFLMMQRLLLLSLIAIAYVRASLHHARHLEEYTGTFNSTAVAVKVTVQKLDDFGSNQKCATFTDGGPDYYTKSCFATIYNETQSIINCAVTFDDRSSCQCSICAMADGSVGFENKCFNFNPTSNTENCTLLDDASIQHVLVDEYVADTQFTFQTETKSGTKGLVVGAVGLLSVVVLQQLW